MRQRKGKKEQNTFESGTFSLYVSPHKKKERKKESAGCELVTDGSVWILLLVPRALHNAQVRSRPWLFSALTQNRKKLEGRHTGWVLKLGSEQPADRAGVALWSSVEPPTPRYYGGCRRRSSTGESHFWEL